MIRPKGALVTSEDLQKDLIKDHPELKMPYTDYRKILFDVSRGLLDKAMEGNDIKLPHGLGIVGVRIVRHSNHKSVKPLVDFQGTKQLREKYPDKEYTAFHTNEQTNGMVVKFLWLKLGKPIVNKRFFKLTISRPVKRKLAARLKNPDIAQNFYAFERHAQKLKRFNNERKKIME